MPLPNIPPGIEFLANGELTELAATMSAFQPEFLADNDKLWQGIRNPATIPADGQRQAPDMSRRPTDQARDWSGLLSNSPRIISTEVHVHDTGAAWGYTIYGIIELAGEFWRRAIGVGAGSESYDWREEENE